MIIPLGLVKFRLESVFHRTSSTIRMCLHWRLSDMDGGGWLAGARSLQDLKYLCQQQVHMDLTLFLAEASDNQEISSNTPKDFPSHQGPTDGSRLSEDWNLGFTGGAVFSAPLFLCSLSLLRPPRDLFVGHNTVRNCRREL